MPFGDFQFENEPAVDRATADHFVNINGKQVEIKKAEPRDGPHNPMAPMDPAHIGTGSWGGQMMGNGNFQIGMPNINTPAGFQQWGASQSGYNYGSTNPSNPSFAWPTQWGNNNFAVPPHQQQSAQGYSAYDYSAYNASTGNYGNGQSWTTNSWNPNLTSIAPNAGSQGSAEIYPHRPQSGHNMHAPPPPQTKQTQDFNGGAPQGYPGNGAYGNYYNEQQGAPAPFSNPNRPRSYGNNEQYPAF